MVFSYSCLNTENWYHRFATVALSVASSSPSKINSKCEITPSVTPPWIQRRLQKVLEWASTMFIYTELSQHPVYIETCSKCAQQKHNPAMKTKLHKQKRILS